MWLKVCCCVTETVQKCSFGSMFLGSKLLSALIELLYKAFEWKMFVLLDNGHTAPQTHCYQSGKVNGLLTEALHNVYRVGV